MELEPGEGLAEIYASLGMSPPIFEAGDDVPSPAELVLAARRFHRRLRSRLNEALEDAGLSYAQFEVLDLIATDPDLHAGSVAQRLGTTRQSVHALVRRMFEAGLIRMLPLDEGIRGLRITDPGRAVLERCHLGLEPLYGLFARLSGEDRNELHRGLETAEAALRPPPRWSF